MVVLPVAAFLSLLSRFAAPDRDIRDAFVRAAVVWGTILLAMSEGLSLFGDLSPVPLACSWALIALLGFPWRRKWTRPTSIEIPFVFLIPVVIILLSTVVLALVSAPNNFDSMTYHMSRVAHWMQNRSLHSYSTNIHRQLFMGEWAECAILHFQILSGGSDRFANLVQWFPFLGCMIAASAIVAKMGGARSAQWTAALLVATTPEVIAQSTSTQTDLSCAFWVICFVNLLFEEDRWLWAGLAIGLAIATKGTAYLFCAPLLAAHLFMELRSTGLRRVLDGAAVVATLVVALNAVQFSRNITIFANPLGDPVHLTLLTNESHRPAALISNIVKNLSLHLGTPFESINRQMTAGITAIHRALGINVNDPATSVFGEFEVPMMSTHEDFAGNLVLLMLILTSVAVLRRFSREVRLYLLCVAAGFFLFCVFLKWQPWNTRLHTTLFVLGVVPVAIMLGELVGRKVWKRGIAFSFFALALPWVVLNASRPAFNLPTVGSVFVTSREAQYFVNKPELRTPFRQLVIQIAHSGCRQIGLKTHENGWEYPLWQMTRGLSLRIEHVAVDLPKVVFTDSFQPCLLISMEQPLDFHFNGGDWHEVWHNHRIRLFAAD